MEIERAQSIIQHAHDNIEHFQLKYGPIHNGMTIDEAMECLIAPVCADAEVDREKKKQLEAYNIARNIMQNYKELEQIVDNYRYYYDTRVLGNDAWSAIKEVIDNGYNNK